MGKFIALSAPSGAGKTTIARALVRRHKNMVISVSATTRPMRPGEQDGLDYHFLTRQVFEENIQAGNFVEHEEVHGNLYGTLKQTIEDHQKAGKSVVFDIDVKGALAIKHKYPDTILIFINAPSEEELIERLRKRKSENEASIKKRLQRIKFELSYADKFDHIVINDTLEHTLVQIEEIIYSQR